jgi:hypothetical protein
MGLNKSLTACTDVPRRLSQRTSPLPDFPMERTSFRSPTSTSTRSKTSSRSSDRSYLLENQRTPTGELCVDDDDSIGIGLFLDVTP